MCSAPLCKWIARYTVETVEEAKNQPGSLVTTQVLLLCQKHLKAWKRQQHDEKEEEEEEHCPSTCQYASKIECTCRCGGVNHGIKSMIKMDAFFAAREEEVVTA